MYPMFYSPYIKKEDASLIFKSRKTNSIVFGIFLTIFLVFIEFFFRSMAAPYISYFTSQESIIFSIPILISILSIISYWAYVVYIFNSKQYEKKVLEIVENYKDNEMIHVSRLADNKLIILPFISVAITAVELFLYLYPLLQASH